MSAAPNPVLVGQQLTYTLTVVNNGPNDAIGVTVTDILRGGATFNSATPQNICNFNSLTATVTCLLGTLPSGVTRTVTINVTPTAAGALVSEGNVVGTALSAFRDTPS